MAKFVLQNNYFEFNGETKQQISGTAVGRMFALHMYVFSWTMLNQNFRTLKFTNR